MNKQSSAKTNNRGFIVQVDKLPASLPAQLEADGWANIAAKTVEGLYLEPAQSLGAIIGALEEAGVEVLALRCTTQSRAWEKNATFFRKPSRLRNPLSACYLPTARTAA